MALNQAFFTTTGGASTGPGLFAGLYSCTMNNGTCESTPNPVLRDWQYDTSSELVGLALSHVQYTSNSIYAQLKDGTTPFGFQVIQADMTQPGYPISSAALLETSSEECLGGEYFYMPSLTDFVVSESGSSSEDDLYISWQGFYNGAANCDVPLNDNHDEAVWTIGVSKLEKSNECRGIRLEANVNFAKCTTTVATFSDRTCVAGDTNRSTLSTSGACVNADGHSYSNLSGGLATVSLENERYFFYTAFNASDFQHGNPTSLETMVLTNSPNSPNLVVSEFAQIEVEPVFFGWELSDLGTIKISISNHQHTLCQSNMNQGVQCQAFRISSTQEIQVLEGPVHVVSSDAVSKYCKAAENLPAFATGFEVVIGENREPQRSYFGCMGDVAGQGNFVTVDAATGLSRQAESGFFPGSIDFPKTDRWLKTTSPTVAPTSPATPTSPSIKPSAAPAHVLVPTRAPTSPRPTRGSRDFSIGAIIGIVCAGLVGIFLCNGVVFFICRTCSPKEVSPELPK